MGRMVWSCSVVMCVVALIHYVDAAQEVAPTAAFVGPTCLMDMPRIYGTVCWFQNRTYCRCPAGLLCRDGADFYKEPEGSAVGTCMSGPTGTTTQAPQVESEMEKMLRAASSRMAAAAQQVNGVRTALAQLQHDLSLSTSAVDRQGILAEIREVVEELNDALDDEKAAEVALGILTGDIVENNRTDFDLFATTLPPAVEFQQTGLFSETWHFGVAGGSFLLFVVGTVVMFLLIRRRQRLKAYGKVLYAQNGQAYRAPKSDGRFGTVSSHFHPPSIANGGEDYYFNGGESIMGSVRGSSTGNQLRGRKNSSFEKGFGDFDETIGALSRSTRSRASVTSFYPDQAGGGQQDVWVAPAVIQESPFEQQQQQQQADRSSHFIPAEDPNNDRRGSFWVPQAADLADDGLFDYGSARPLTMFDGHTAGAQGGGHYHPPSDVAHNQSNMEDGYGQLQGAVQGHEDSAAAAWQANYNSMWQNVAGSKWEEEQEVVARAVNRQLKPTTKAPALPPNNSGVQSLQEAVLAHEHAAYDGEQVDEYLTLGDSGGNDLRRRGSVNLGQHDPRYQENTVFDGSNEQQGGWGGAHNPAEMAGLQAAGLWDGPNDLQQAVANHEQEASWGGGGGAWGEAEQDGSFPTLQDAVMQHEVDAGDWQSTYDQAQGKSYWHNSATGLVQWERPAGL